MRLLLGFVVVVLWSATVSGQQIPTATFDVGKTAILKCRPSPATTTMVWVYVDHNVTLAEGTAVFAKDRNKYASFYAEGQWGIRIKSLRVADSGHYRCYQLADPTAEGYIILKVGDATVPTLSTPLSSDYSECCRRSDVKAACLPMCDVGNFDLSTFNTSLYADCFTYLPQMTTCFSGGRGHVPCCRRNAVLPKCFPFCLGNSPDVSELLDYAACIAQTQQIIQCFEEGLVTIPGSPRHVVVGSTLPTTAHLAWLAPANAAAIPVVGYRLFWKTAGDQYYTSVAVSNATLKYEVTSLRPNTAYDVYVVSFNHHGMSPPTTTATVTTRASPSSLPPASTTEIEACCTAEGIHPTCKEKYCKINSRLDPADAMLCATHFVPILTCLTGGRNVTRCCQDNGGSDRCLSICHGEVDLFQALGCATETQIFYDCVGQGMILMPGKPMNVYVADVMGTSAVVHWSPPLHSGDKVQEYFIALEDTDGNVLSRQQVTANVTMLKLTGLRPGLQYRTWVNSGNAHGNSLPSSRVHFETSDGGGQVSTTPSMPPFPVHNITACCINRGMPRQCLGLCDYSINLVQLLVTNGTFLGTCTADPDNIATGLLCASDGRNHTPCCERKEVPAQCLGLCALRDSDDLSPELMACLPSTPDIFSCMEDGVVLLPRPPTLLTLYSKSDASAGLSWTPSTSVPAPQYLVKWRPLHQATWNETRPPTGSTSRAMIRGLRRGVTYWAEVVAYNTFGTSVPSERLTFTLEDSSINGTVPTVPPVPLPGGADCCRANSVRGECMPLCTWNMTAKIPDYCYDNEKGQFDLITRCLAGGKDHTSCCQKYEMPSQCLQLCGASSVRPRPSGPGTGPQPQRQRAPLVCTDVFGKEITACMVLGNDHLPSMPRSLVLRGKTAGDATFAWQKPDHNGENVDYTIFYWLQQQQASTRDVMKKKVPAVDDGKDSSSPTGFISGLSPDTRYNVYVVAENVYGASMPSNMLSFLTDDSQTMLKVSVTQSPGGVVRRGTANSLMCISERAQSFRWTKNGTAVGSESLLKLRNVDVKDEGLYTCTASQGANSRNASTVMEVMYKPIVSTPKARVMRKPDAGQSAKLVCRVHGYPNVFSWIGPSGQRVSSTTTTQLHQRIGLEVEMTLVIELVAQNHIGNYSCTARNAYGTGSAVVSLVGPTGPPRPSIKPAVAVPNITACCIQKSVKKECMDVCTFAIDYKLLSDPRITETCLTEMPKLISCAADGRDHTKCCEQHQVPDMCYPYCVGKLPEPVEPQHVVCLASTVTILKCMEDGHKIIPSKPVKLDTINSAGGSVTVSWHPPLKNAQYVQSYEVYYHELPKGEVKTVTTKGWHYRLENLQPRQAYRYYVVASNFFGHSHPSDEHTFTAPVPEVKGPSGQTGTTSNKEGVAVGVGVTVALLAVAVMIAAAVFYYFRVHKPGRHSRLQEEPVQFSRPSYAADAAVNIGAEGGSQLAVKSEAPMSQPQWEGEAVYNAGYVQEGAASAEQQAAFDNAAYHTADLQVATPAEPSADVGDVTFSTTDA